jgi:hypothetical protein
MQMLNAKIEMFKKELMELQEGAENDSKSSAGDKHETARAMMQLEYEKISSMLNDLLHKKSDLEKTDIHSVTGKIKNGSLIKTNHGYLFLGPTIGKITVDEIPVMTISLQSPVGAQLSGRKAGDRVEVNGMKYVIENIS